LLRCHLQFPQLEVVASTEVGAGSFGPVMCPAQEVEELSQEERLTWEVAFCFGYVPTQEEPIKMTKITCYPIHVQIIQLLRKLLITKQKSQK
jgi:hypothetical protein